MGQGLALSQPVTENAHDRQARFRPFAQDAFKLFLANAQHTHVAYGNQ
jgi:hypothetical protein